MEKKQIRKNSPKNPAAKAPASPFDSFASSPAQPLDTSAVEKPKKPARTKRTATAAVKPAADSKKTAVKLKTEVPPASPAIDPIAPASPFVAEAETTTSTAAEKAGGPAAKVSPAFKALSEPVLPLLKRENRARLMMQTPTELYFYWSVRENPYQMLRKAFGSDTGSYTLALKLTNLNTGQEDLHPAEAEGNWWFHVEPNGKYEAEIGFYAPNRPYFRVIYSNTVETPRRAPSPRPATEAVWTVSANKFAEVLDVAGFTNDAIDVAMAGDDAAAAESATQTAFTHLTGVKAEGAVTIAGEDIRYALRALASGVALEELRHSVGAKLFGILQTRSADLSSDKAVSALEEYFDLDTTEYTEEEAGPRVFGASLVNFPRTMRPRETFKRFAPISSHSYR